MLNSKGARDCPERETAALGFQPSTAAKSSSPKNSQSERKCCTGAVQAVPATLTETVGTLRDHARLDARLCSELREDGSHNGSVVKWPGEPARYATNRDLPRLRLRLEALGLIVSPELLAEALILVDPAPLHVNAIRFLEGGAA